MKRDKLALRFGEQTLLELTINRFTPYFDTVYISVAEEDKYPQIKAPRLVDVYKGCGPMAGLHAALSRSDDEGVFLVAADLPFADPAAAKRLIELAGTSDVSLTADSRSRFEPLFAYYKKTMLEPVENALKAGNYKIATLIAASRVHVVTREEFGSLWNDKLLLNINYPEDYQMLLEESTSDSIGTPTEKDGQT